MTKKLNNCKCFVEHSEIDKQHTLYLVIFSFVDVETHQGRALRTHP